MNALDLFGKESRPPRASLRPIEPPVRLSLFDAAAERNALASGRSLAQERVEVKGAHYLCLCGQNLVRRPGNGLCCEACDR